jgi:hypothetical protein
MLFPGKDLDNPKAAVPWKELFSRTTEYVRVKYLPADITLMDPSHIRADDVVHLLDHWYARQAHRKPVLRFQPVVRPGHSGGLGPLYPDPIQGEQGIVPQSRVLKTTISDHDTDASCSDGVTPEGYSPSLTEQPQPGHPTVSKKAAGPGRSSQNRQFNLGSSLPDHQSRAKTQPVSCLPTPPILQSDKNLTELSPDPSVSAFSSC